MTPKEQDIYNTLADKMDKRDNFFEALLQVEKLGHGIPAKYANDAAIMLNFESYKLQGSWRNSKAITDKLKKAAKKIARKKH
jgi:hypothetical protein